MVFPVRDVPWWGVLSSAAAAVLLAGGWTVAAMLQPGSFDQVTQTISALAAHGATDRWVMTLALLSVGACHVITGLALRPAASPGRILLMTGGVATVLVAANPVPAGAGHSVPHTVAAAVAFLALAAWPAAGGRRGPSVPWVLRPAVCAGASAVLLCLLGWFYLELVMAGMQLGLAERVAAEAQALWPLAVIVMCYRRQSLARRPSAGPAR
ncbi:MAG TPA: DUF998 domain-containing protein [Streptosporangiaceae bacterium]